MKFEEKFVKRPQQIKAKIEREKNILKKIDNVVLFFIEERQSTQSHFVLLGAECRHHAGDVKERVYQVSRACVIFFINEEMCVWRRRTLLLLNTRTSSRRVRL